MNLPNSITLARLLMTGIFLAAIASNTPTGLIIAFVAFLVATASDWLDGYLARKLNLVTSLGKLLDPLADKILVAAAFIVFTGKGLCPAWITAVIIGREFLVTGLRQIAVEKGVVIAADNLGKWKTTLQLAFSITALLYLNAPNLQFIQPTSLLFKSLLYLALILTVLSGINYLKQSSSLLLDTPPKS